MNEEQIKKIEIKPKDQLLISELEGKLTNNQNINFNVQQVVDCFNLDENLLIKLMNNPEQFQNYAIGILGESGQTFTDSPALVKGKAPNISPEIRMSCMMKFVELKDADLLYDDLITEVVLKNLTKEDLNKILNTPEYRTTFYDNAIPVIEDNGVMKMLDNKISNFKQKLEMKQLEEIEQSFSQEKSHTPSVGK